MTSGKTVCCGQSLGIWDRSCVRGHESCRGTSAGSFATEWYSSRPCSREHRSTISCPAHDCAGKRPAWRWAAVALARLSNSSELDWKITYDGLLDWVSGPDRARTAVLRREPDRPSFRGGLTSAGDQLAGVKARAYLDLILASLKAITPCTSE